MNKIIADRLAALAADDLNMRERLAKDGSLFDGYHPEMEAVHEANARELETIISAIGWPTSKLVGKDGAEAAWLIAQHAIGMPSFQRQCLAMIKQAVAMGEAPAWQMALLLDRVLIFEGHPQLYGTQFDWDDDGQLSPLRIEDSDGVDQRRQDVGLEPLEVATRRLRTQDAARSRPADLVEHRRRMNDWAQKAGWR